MTPCTSLFSQYLVRSLVFSGSRECVGGSDEWRLGAPSRTDAVDRKFRAAGAVPTLVPYLGPCPRIAIRWSRRVTLPRHLTSSPVGARAASAALLFVAVYGSVPILRCACGTGPDSAVGSNGPSAGSRRPVSLAQNAPSQGSGFYVRPAAFAAPTASGEPEQVS
jgi:hypothetical protein